MSHTFFCSVFVGFFEAWFRAAVSEEAFEPDESRDRFEANEEASFEEPDPSTESITRLITLL